MKLWLAIALLPLMLADGQDEFLSRLEGRWSGKGTVLNQPSQVEMSWEWTLSNQFLRLSFRNDMGSEPKVSRFEGQALYRAVSEGRYRGMWFDNSGMMRPIEAAHHDGALIAKWGTPDTEQGETTYRIAAEGRLEVTDRVKSKDGTWRTFGQSTLMKQPR